MIFRFRLHRGVATVLTVYGIETVYKPLKELYALVALQQYLPFTVLKPLTDNADGNLVGSIQLQQYLPFTVLKQPWNCHRNKLHSFRVATVLTVYGIETLRNYYSLKVVQVATVLTVYGIETLYIGVIISSLLLSSGCNSTYRLRY